MDKRSFSIAGHRTSLALEPEFWAALREIAQARGMSMAALIGEIDTSRTTDNLSSATRLYALAWYRDGEVSARPAPPAD